MMHRIFSAIVLITFLFPNFADAWNDKTHMAIAYIAYRKLNHHAKDRVNEILVLHPLYSQWTKGAKLGQAGFLAFLQAAAWPDCIQTPKCPGYVQDGTDGGLIPTSSQQEWQNIGFADMLMHKYWHFVQVPYVAEGQPAEQTPRPNVETQLQILADALNSNAGDALKSFDLAWVENLVGEVHQPLNCVSRFSAEHPNGDRNGRDVKVRDASPAGNLHDYWDNLLGTEEDLESGVKEGKILAGNQDQEAWWDAADVDTWVSESVDLAKKRVYTPAVISDDANGKAVVLDAIYRKAAIKVAEKQAFAAGNRLASFLDENLK
jgi:hypothetical protein